MPRESLLTEIRTLAALAGWTANDLAHLTGRWGKLATVQQLTACRDRMWDLTADGTDIVDIEQEELGGWPASQDRAAPGVESLGFLTSFTQRGSATDADQPRQALSLALDAWAMSWMPLATFTSTPEPVSTGEEAALRNAARFGLLKDRSKLAKIAAWKAQVERERRVEVMGRVA